MITINNKEYEFKLTFSKIQQLEKQIGKIVELEAWISDFQHTVKIASILTGVSEDELLKEFDADGTIEPYRQVVESLSKQITSYFTPNLPTPQN